jgi:hypothetical protein
MSLPVVTARFASLLLVLCGACSGGGSSVSGSGGGTSRPGGPVTIAIFPPDNPWNTDISGAPVDPLSDAYLASIGLDTGLHPDFGANPDYGIPFVVVDEGQPLVPITFDYADESDPGPYPIPDDAPIEGGPGATGDRHVIVIDESTHTLYEVFAAERLADGWHGGSGATWDLRSNALRPDGWTSADAAGLPIFPGLVNADEVVALGEIDHALRFTARSTQRAYAHPARHFASSSTDPTLPPMGLRVRLKADFDESDFPEDCRVILRALKKYGMFLADNGSDWYVSGTSDPRWNDGTLRELRNVRGRDFEAIETGPLVTD